MITIHWHIPTYVDMDPLPPETVANQEELLNLERSRIWSEGWFDGEDFDFWCIDDGYLMAQYKGAERMFWVVGRITQGKELLNLPQWVHPAERQR